MKVGSTFSYPNMRRPDNGSKTLSELKFQVTNCSYEIIDLIVFSEFGIDLFFATADRRLLGCGHPVPVSFYDGTCIGIRIMQDLYYSVFLLTSTYKYLYFFLISFDLMFIFAVNLRLSLYD